LARWLPQVLFPVIIHYMIFEFFFSVKDASVKGAVSFDFRAVPDMFGYFYFSL
jgi:hypothetical protein